MFSSPTLHPPVLISDEHKSLALDRLDAITRSRRSRLAEFAAVFPSPGTVTVPLSTVSSAGGFDAYLEVGLRGADPAAPIRLLLDSGNTCLILPDFAAITALPNFATDYRILVDNVLEPWQAPAAILRGPIDIPTASGQVYSLDDCVFYACKGPNAEGVRTANFGLGCVSAWTMDHGVELRTPLTYGPALRYAAVSYDAAAVLAVASTPRIGESAALVLSAQPPAGFQTFAIVPNSPWMALVPRRLTIEAVGTAWPVARPDAIAMIDTGGGPIYLSDPDRFVCGAAWPQPAALPAWALHGSVACEAVRDSVTIELGDAGGSYSYTVNPANLPAGSRDLTLVMCQNCAYMMGRYGMNIGGISALFNSILIDFGSKRVGFKAR